MTVEMVVRLKSICEVLIVICGVIGTIAGVGVWHLGNVEKTADEKEKDKLKNEVSALRAKTTARRVDAVTREKLKSALAGMPRGKVRFLVSPDIEPRIFANEISSVLNEAGFTTEMSVEMLMPITGQILLARDADHPPTHGGPLRKALNDAGIRVGGKSADFVGENEVVFMIGPTLEWSGVRLGDAGWK